MSVESFQDGKTTHAGSPPGVQFHDILTRFLSGSGGIDNVINDVGGAVSSANPGPNYVVSYP